MCVCACVSVCVCVAIYRRPTFKCEGAINANVNFPPDLQLLERN